MTVAPHPLNPLLLRALSIAATLLLSMLAWLSGMTFNDVRQLRNDLAGVAGIVDDVRRAEARITGLELRITAVEISQARATAVTDRPRP
ncbi:MAG: hypothetical protein C0434_17690 [Xanthomonadaceae bacterium]|nr:hypothetical protein [Xanthomonadaceae bacterium]